MSLNFDWLYGTWQFDIDATNMSIVSSTLKDKYQLNICFINNKIYYVRFDSNKNGTVDWYGPFNIVNSIEKLIPDKDGLLYLSSPTVTRPPQIENWPLKVVTQDEFFSNPIIIDTKKFNVGIDFLKYQYILYAVKGCNLKSSPYPANCYPKEYDKTIFEPSICPLKYNPEKPTIPMYVIIIAIIILLFIIILILSTIFFYIKSKNCKH